MEKIAFIPTEIARLETLTLNPFSLTTMLSHTFRSLSRCFAVSIRLVPLQACAARRIQRASLLHRASTQSRMMSTPPPQVNERSVSVHLRRQRTRAYLDLK